jgi:guanylate kinase
MKGKLIVFSGPSGSGKTTIVKSLLKEQEINAEFSVSAASRDKRYNEIDGKDYYFLSPEQFRKKISENAFVEWEEVYQNCFYGTLFSEIERIRLNGKNVIFDIDVKGALNIKKKFGIECLTVFVMPPSIEELEYRLRKRATESEESLSKRLSKANYEMTFAEKFDCIVINEGIESTVNEAVKTVKEFIKN